MYVQGNPQTKKVFKEMVAEANAGKREPVRLFAPGLGSPAIDGQEWVSGPHGTHVWYAEVEMKDGAVIKVR
jgi:hypothetical protein